MEASTSKMFFVFVNRLARVPYRSVFGTMRSELDGERCGSYEFINYSCRLQICRFTDARCYRGLFATSIRIRKELVVVDTVLLLFVYFSLFLF